MAQQYSNRLFFKKIPNINLDIFKRLATCVTRRLNTYGNYNLWIVKKLKYITHFYIQKSPIKYINYGSI